MIKQLKNKMKKLKTLYKIINQSNLNKKLNKKKSSKKKNNSNNKKNKNKTIKK